MKLETQLWIEQAKEQFDDALYLYQGSRYSMAVYCCHQALEKILKAAIVDFTNQVPPKIHNLDALARKTTLNLPPSWYEDLAEITRHFRRVRYPDFRRHKYTSKGKIQPTIDKTQEIYLWVLQKFNQH